MLKILNVQSHRSYLLSFVGCAALLASAGDQADHLAREMQRLTSEGDYSAAAAIVPQAQREAERPGVSNVSAALLRNQIGLVQQQLGQHAESERSYLRAIQQLDKTDSSSPTMAYLLRNLATLYLDTGEPGHAEQVCRRGLQLAAQFAPSSAELGMFYLTLGAARQQQGDRRDAKRQYEQALSLGGGGPNGKLMAALFLGNLGVVEAMDRQWQSATQHLEQSLALHQELFGRSHPDGIRPNLNLAHVHVLRKQWAQAGEYLAAAREIAETRLGGGHPIMIEILTASARVLRNSGQRGQANELDKQAHSIMAARSKEALSKSRVDVTDLAASWRKK